MSYLGSLNFLLLCKGQTKLTAAERQKPTLHHSSSRFSTGQGSILKALPRIGPHNLVSVGWSKQTNKKNFPLWVRNGSFVFSLLAKVLVLPLLAWQQDTRWFTEVLLSEARVPGLAGLGEKHYLRNRDRMNKSSTARLSVVHRGIPTTAPATPCPGTTLPSIPYH